MKILGAYILQDLGFNERAKAMGYSEKEVESMLLEAKRLYEDESELLSCPDCNSDDISSEGFSDEGNWKTVCCKKCDTRWVEYYNFRTWEYEDS